jgi:hypothetical protein
VVHDAQHPEENAPPVPHANTWFPEENPRSNGNHNAESSDDEIEIASATVNLKDLFTMQYFKEPWTSKTCGHTFEKSAFLDYLQSSGSDFQEAPPSRRRVRRVKCPQTGCDQVSNPPAPKDLPPNINVRCLYRKTFPLIKLSCDK